MNELKTSSVAHATDMLAARRRRAFTLLELLVAVIVVTTVAGILLPALQPLREQYARDQAEIISNHLRLSALDYRAFHGESAETLQQIVEFDPPPFDLTLEEDGSGIAAGYKYRYVVFDAGFEFFATPGIPGVTGGVDLLTRDDGEVLEFPTDGADAGREALLRAARLKGLETIATLLLTESTPEDALEIVTTVQDPTVVVPAANFLDENSDGMVSPGEISEHTTSDLVNVLLLDLRETAQYGAFGEDTDALPGVHINDLTGDPGELYSYFTVSELVGKYYPNRGLANSLAKKLFGAENSYDSGKDAVGAQQLSAFQLEIDAHSGKLISDDEASILQFYAEGLKVAEEE